jgi:hypothetical protein
MYITVVGLTRLANLNARSRDRGSMILMKLMLPPF